MYSIEFTETADKQFSKLDNKIQERIFSALNRLKIRPMDHLVKLVSIPAYKFRIGDYRTICTVDNEKQVIYVIKVGHRKNIYDDL